MISKFVKTLVVLLLVSPVLAGDLFLLSINNFDDLDNAQRFVAHALGTMDGKFIVDLDDHQIRQLQKANLTVESISRRIDLERLCLVIENPMARIRTPVDFMPLYSSGNRHLALLSSGDDQILSQAGYQVIPIGIKQTPLFYNPPGRMRLPRDNYPTDTLGDLVIQDSLYSYNLRLQNFQTRLSTTDSCLAARDWIRDKFQSFGYTGIDYEDFIASRESFGIGPHKAYNVVCVKPGYEYPDKLIVIGGHYDSINFDNPGHGLTWAPGADDNASGVVCVLELARIMSTFDNRKTLVFVAFGAEELGLWGSEHMAEYMYQDGTDLELMINLDMVGFTDDTDPDVDIISANDGYELYLDAVEGVLTRLTDLYINYDKGTDYVPFAEHGFRCVSFHEGDFNYDGWHTDIDVVSRMNFPYLTKIARTMIATVGMVDQAHDPVVFDVFDHGDGQAVRVVWDDCQPDYSYQIFYGPSAYIIMDTIEVPGGHCYYDITGLTEGEELYFGIRVIPDVGVPSIAVNVVTVAPLVNPRVPESLTAEPDSAAIKLDWEANTELDFSHYLIFRRPVGGVWGLYQDDHPINYFVDESVVPHQDYQYKICAVDNDGYVSDTSAMAVAVPATFDGGILFVDETQPGGDMSGETDQNLYYGAILDTFAYDILKIDDSSDYLTKNKAGQYNPVFWVDDDNQLHLWELSLDSLDWYLTYHTDFLLAGWETITHITGQTYFLEGDVFHDELGLSYVGKSVLPDFIGAFGEGDWPDLELKPEAPNNARLDNIQIFQPIDEAEEIYRFNSYSSHQYYHNKPVGVAYDTYEGKRVVLGFPLYWLTEASAQALVQKVMEYFAAPSVYVNGDVNDDRIVNLLDVTYLIAYLYQGGPPPVRINHGDPNNDCTINILDVVYLISYLYNAGPAPLTGCVDQN